MLSLLYNERRDYKFLIPLVIVLVLKPIVNRISMGQKVGNGVSNSSVNGNNSCTKLTTSPFCKEKRQDTPHPVSLLCFIIIVIRGFFLVNKLEVYKNGRYYWLYCTRLTKAHDSLVIKIVDAYLVFIKQDSKEMEFLCEYLYQERTKRRLL